MPKDEVTRDTIAAIASAPGRGGIGVVRVSGPRVPRIAAAVAGALPAPRRATLSVFSDSVGARIDEGIALYFAAPNSYTGEDVLELQGHGGPVVLQMVLGACIDAGARLAEPGEFTQRAYLEGKLDLAQAEAVADLIDAASREAVRSAQRSLSGEFSAAVHALVSHLTELRALIEAMLDFPDEEVDVLHRNDAATRLGAIRSEVAHLLARSRQGSLLSVGIHVVIAGPPNVGKSSLLNRLAGEERAIVTAQAGTTRDALREPIEIHGVPIVIVDTAGLRESSDEVERLGIARTRRELELADVVLAISEAGAKSEALENFEIEAARIDVFNKVDLAPTFEAPAGRYPKVLVSAKTGAGLDALREAILKAAGWTSTGESAFLARERHLRALNSATMHLDTAERESSRWEFFAEELRLAQLALGQITGEVSADELLGEIFARFCIGK
jgi:tRNA modification GTPase